MLTIACGIILALLGLLTFNALLAAYCNWATEVDARYDARKAADERSAR